MHHSRAIPCTACTWIFHDNDDICGWTKRLPRRVILFCISFTINIKIIANRLVDVAVRTCQQVTNVAVVCIYKLPSSDVNYSKVTAHHPSETPVCAQMMLTV